MTIAILRRKYEWRYALYSMLVMAIVLSIGVLVDADNVVWGAIGALLSLQTSRGTPARQGLSTLFMTVIAVLAGFGLSRYVIQLELYMSLMLGTALFCSVVFMQNRLTQDASILQWLLFAVVIMMAALWPATNEMMLAQRILFVVAGGALGILCRLLVLPVMPYQEFCQGLAPILNALIRYSNALAVYLQGDRSADETLEKRLMRLEKVLQSPRDEYPEWVFEAGFNRNFRSSFRYVLVQLDSITDAFFSLDYHARQAMDAELLAEVAPHLALVLAKNVELLKIIRAFFAGESIVNDHENFTSDITSIQNSLQSVLPASMELLDVSPDYVNITALARDVVDIRELLLQMIAGLPMDDSIVAEHE